MYMFPCLLDTKMMRLVCCVSLLLVVSLHTVKNEPVKNEPVKNEPVKTTSAKPKAPVAATKAPTVKAAAVKPVTTTKPAKVVVPKSRTIASPDPNKACAAVSVRC